MDQIEKLYDESVATKNQIIRANLRLVVSIAKRYVGPAEDFFELVSDGNMSLIRAVEKFDFSRGNKFSTYASWAIMKNFARTIPDALRHRDRFRTSHSEMFSTVEDVRADHYEQESAQIQRESQVQGILDATRRAGAADCHESFWPHSRPGAADVEASRSRDGRNQRAGPADPVSGDEQIEKGCRGGPNRVPRVKNNRIASFAQSSAIRLPFPVPRRIMICWWSSDNLSAAPPMTDSKSSDD